MRIALIIGCLLALVTGAAAQAQTSPEERQEKMGQAATDRRLMVYARNWTPERVDRAERLTVLANAGQCAEGVNLARDEDDDAMADALVVACEERFERADRLASTANTGHCDQAIETARRERDTPMAEVLAEMCQRIQLARTNASPEDLAAAARNPAAFDVRTMLVGEWAEQCLEDGGSRMIYADDGTVRINSRRGRWSVDDGLLVETFNMMVPGAIGDRGRLTQHSRISREGRFGIRKQVVYRSPGAFPPDVILYRCDT